MSSQSNICLPPFSRIWENHDFISPPNLGIWESGFSHRFYFAAPARHHRVNGVCRWIELNFKIKEYCINSIRLVWNCKDKSVSNTVLLTESFVSKQFHCDSLSGKWLGRCCSKLGTSSFCPSPITFPPGNSGIFWWGVFAHFNMIIN